MLTRISGLHFPSVQLLFLAFLDIFQVLSRAQLICARARAAFQHMQPTAVTRGSSHAPHHLWLIAEGRGRSFMQSMHALQLLCKKGL